MSDLKEFLLAAKEAIVDLEKSLPGNIAGPVSNPLHRIAAQLAGAETRGKGLKLLHNVLLASAMLLCTASTFKPIPLDDGELNNDSRTDDLIAEAVVRYVVYCLCFYCI